MRNINNLANAGKKKITDRRSLYATDYVQLIEESALNGSDSLLELISKVYAIGFEKGYTACKYDTKKKQTARKACRRS